MFKNMYYTHKSFEHPFKKSFALHIYLYRFNELQRTNLTILSNKILDGVIYNCNLEEMYQRKILLPSLDQTNLQQRIFSEKNFKKEIYFPAGKFFATYKYTFSPITLYPKTTLVLFSKTPFEPVTILFTSEYQNINNMDKNNYYSCIIQQNLLR